MIECTGSIVAEIGPWLNKKHKGTKIEVCADQSELIACINKQNKFRINYGIQGVQELKRLDLAATSIAGHEILMLGYMGSKLTFHNIITHVCLHETSHLVQMLNMQRMDTTSSNEYHDEYFYKILTRLHNSKIGLDAASRMRGFLNDLGIEDSFSCGAVIYPEDRRVRCMNLKHGDIVKFHALNSSLRGTVIGKSDLFAKIESQRRVFSIGLFGVDFD